MATLNAHGSFYRIQDNITRVQKNLGDNMQRLSSGLKNISAGSRPGDVAVVNSMTSGIKTLEYGKANAEAGVAALEMAVSDISRLSDIITRLYEMNQVGANVFTTADDKAMLKLEFADLSAEYKRVGDEIKYRGQDLAQAAAGLTVEVGSVVFGTVTLDLSIGTIGASIGNATATEVSTGGAGANLKKDKKLVDTIRLEAASKYNMASWHAMHAANHLAATKIEVGNYRDVDFAAETSELAKNQIIAQAGTAMLAQANAQGQGVLALLQT